MSRQTSPSIELEAIAETPVDAENRLADHDVDDAADGRLRRVLRWGGRRWAALTVAVVFLVSFGAASAVYRQMYLPDQQTNAAVERQVVDAATQGAMAVLTYGPETLDEDLATAKSLLTGDFLTYYGQFVDQVVAPAVVDKGVQTSASVVKAAASDLQPDRATVLLFVNQVTTSRDRPESASATSSVMVTLAKIGDRWLISEFNPV